MERLKEYATQYNDGLLTADETLDRIILEILAQKGRGAGAISQGFCAQLCDQLVKD